MKTAYYHASNGQPRLIANMATPHLENALAKLERHEGHRVDEIAAIRAEIATRPDRKDGQ